MVFSISAKTAAAIMALLTATVHGHIIMVEPVPFDFPVASTKQSPLDASGADFPCKFPAGFTPTQHDKNPVMAPGSSHTLRFEGGATHGGGSCQVSITKDTVPTKNSEWKVIKSIEGGCPSDAEGNLSGSATTPNPTTFKYTIPSGLAPGKYTIAWSWFNKIGNREMYMNCAPVQIGGGAGKRDVPKINKKRQSALPNMFKANIGNGCSTTEGTDVTFPDPGADLQRGAKVVPGKPVGNCGAAGPTPVAGGNNAGSGNNASGGEEAPEAPAPAPQPSAAPAPQPPAAPAPQPPAAPAPPASAGGAGAAGSACSTEGAFICAPDGNSFQRCASGVITVPQQMSAGVRCVPGTDPTTLKMVAVKRSVRFGAEHLAVARDM